MKPSGVSACTTKSLPDKLAVGQLTSGTSTEYCSPLPRHYAKPRPRSWLEDFLHLPAICAGAAANVLSPSPGDRALERGRGVRRHPRLYRQRAVGSLVGVA